MRGERAAQEKPSSQLFLFFQFSAFQRFSFTLPMPFSGKPLHAGGSNSLVSTIYSTLFKKWRARRMADFEHIIQPRPGERILDVGGYHATWQNASFHGCSVDLVNIDCESESKPARALANGLLVREIRGNGCALPFTDGSYDIVYSNSVIEHVGSVEDQLAFAREACRVGKRLWIQTPAVACPIEPHFLGPCIHWFPRRIRPLAARLFPSAACSAATVPRSSRNSSISPA
jgi:ubiquinone/menaquinone biosynthesis C-methylase UbiE